MASSKLFDIYERNTIKALLRCHRYDCLHYGYVVPAMVRHLPRQITATAGIRHPLLQKRYLFAMSKG
jgi:hypothetical protein